ncbi:MAG: tRNA uridine-5-carboxymethylaminomethyl(34) synthesis GTPase MnmE [Bacteroidaceae bacterium]|nr:tRNA uridine-5-carboxymethylaminomethyl(34) synthesis GTPase MnmE [Bacteroidaceae bacterium]
MKGDTICALATAQGGAINVIRVSGERAVELVSGIFVPKGNVPLEQRKSHTVIFGDLCTDGSEILDEVLVTVMRAPHSYTGEDSVEISCHASAYITQQVMLSLLDMGARQADPGEFTMRAFLNGKMDLSRAEAVADLVASTSRASHRLAMNQLKGGFSHELGNLRNKLLKLTTLMELELDFGEEDVTFADRGELLQLCDEVETVMSRLAGSFSVGNAVKNGVPVAIVGETNAGKSTLLNALLHEDRAIVSDICGTTRDTIEGTMTLSGVAFRFIDTAGLRETHDVVERMGIERTLEQLKKSSIALWIIDPAAEAKQIEELARKLLPVCEGKKLAILVNKCDVIDPITLSKAMEWAKLMLGKYGNGIEWEQRDMWAISARQGTNMDKLEEFLVRSAAMPSIAAGDVVVTNVRHYEALVRALENIREVKHGLAGGLPGDLVSEHLRAAIGNLSEIVGEVTNDEILGNIFANFCIGK